MIGIEEYDDLVRPAAVGCLERTVLPTPRRVR